MMQGQKHVVVIGAGVIGLQTAISLLEAGYNVTIIAKHFPGDSVPEYTSPWAGAHWSSHASTEDLELQAWDAETYNHWLSLIARELNEPSTTPKSGLGLFEERLLTVNKEPAWFANAVLNFKHIPILALPEGIVQGHTYISVMVNSPMYLQYLLDTAISLGSTTIRATLPRSTTLAGTLRYATDIVRSKSPSPPSIDAFINATGLGARELVPDSTMFPIRGQTVTVKGEAKGITTIHFATPTTKFGPSDPTTVYVLPRPHSGTTILGGTKQKGDWNAEPDPETARKILENAKEWAPELLNERGEFEVLSSQVGLRPGREGGARVELETVGDFVICHAYGHASSGYQNSVGSARKVVRLIDGHFRVRRESERGKL